MKVRAQEFLDVVHEKSITKIVNNMNIEIVSMRVRQARHERRKAQARQCPCTRRRTRVPDNRGHNDITQQIDSQKHQANQKSTMHVHPDDHHQGERAWWISDW